MVKRYDGNTGRVTHVEERQSPPRREPERPAVHGERRQFPPQRGPEHSAAHAPPKAPPVHNALPLQLQRLLPAGVSELVTEDLLLLLILYLLYRESGDKDWLVTLGAMLFL